MLGRGRNQEIVSTNWFPPLKRFGSQCGVRSRNRRIEVQNGHRSQNLLDRQPSGFTPAV